MFLHGRHNGATNPTSLLANAWGGNFTVGPEAELVPGEGSFFELLNLCTRLQYGIFFHTTEIELPTESCVPGFNMGFSLNAMFVLFFLKKQRGDSRFGKLESGLAALNEKRSYEIGEGNFEERALPPALL